MCQLVACAYAQGYLRENSSVNSTNKNSNDSGVVLKNYTHPVAPVMDLDHDLACYFHTPDLLKRKMDLLSDCGFKRLYVVAPPPGDPDYSTRLLPDNRGNFLRLSRENLCDDPLKMAITYAKEAGMEAFVVFKPYEGGGTFSVPHNVDPPLNRNWIETLSGRAVGLDPFILEHPEMRVERKAIKEYLSRPVDRIEMIFVLDRIPGREGLKNESGIMEIVQRPDRPHLGTNAVSRFPAEEFVIYASTNNGSYSKISGDIAVSDETDFRQILNANGESLFPEPVLCRVITLSGFTLSEPYLAVSFKGDAKAFKTIPYSESCFTAYSGDKKLPITVTPRVRDGLLTLKYGFINNGFEFEEIGPYYWDHGWKTKTLFGFARGREKYQRAALCEAYPEVRAHWLDQVQHYIDLGCDGIDVRLACHSVGITDFVNYGFNAPLIAAYQAQYGVDIAARPLDPIKMMRLRGELFMEFLEDAAELLHRNDLALQLHFNNYMEAPTLDTTFPGAGFWASPKVVPDWRRMIEIADEITIKDYNWGRYDSRISNSIKDVAFSAGKPLWVHCYMQQGHDLSDPFLQAVEQDQRVTGVLLYEVKYSAGRVNDGMVEFTKNGTVRLVPGTPIHSMLIKPPQPLLRRIE